MAPAKNRPDKSKRYRQNKAQREARAARSARAGEATAIARGERQPTATPAGAEATKTGAGGSTPAKRGKRPSPWTIPGQRAVVLAFMFSIVSAATLLLAPIQVPLEVPADDPRVEEGDEPDDDGMVTIYEDGKLVEEETAPVAAVVLLAPIAITGAAVWFTKRPQRATAWTMAMLAMAAYVFFVGSYGVIALPALIALAVGGFQLRRSESKERVAEIKANRAARKAAKDGGEVIDVDPVDDDPPEQR